MSRPFCPWGTLKCPNDTILKMECSPMICIWGLECCGPLNEMCCGYISGAGYLAICITVTFVAIVIICICCC
ncbi:unnamed protein product [Cylicocyclus nassatus]|uniref:Uncharacterized protein n=1 Tax=Cylicocyclus nassatus TaxID=53992 RepID=A0AA36DVI0_CYLNA|nr:unnamed protein product [Cylicocyclus nassatus]